MADRASLPRRAGAGLRAGFGSGQQPIALPSRLDGSQAYGTAAGPAVQRALIRDHCSLHRPYAGAPRQKGEEPITQLMYLIWIQRRDLQRKYDLGTARGRSGLRTWYRTWGAIELDLAHWLSDCPSAPKGHPRSYGELARNLLRNGKPFLLLKLPGLLWRWDGPIARTTESLGLKLGRQLCDFAVAVAKRLPDISGRLRTERIVPLPASGDARLHPLLNLRAADDLRLDTYPSNGKGLPEKGVNIVGYARGEMGLGEDTRTIARALATQNAPMGVVNFERGLFARKQDRSVDRWIMPACRYRTNVFPMAANEVHSAVLDIGVANYDRRYNIGYLPWELPRWPKAWIPYLDLIDEIWVSTSFTYESLRSINDKPVCLMPLAVTVDEVAPVKRADYGLPDESFLFFCSFDIISSVHRKNPFAAIEAFRRAFPKGDEPVGLVVKAMNFDPLVPNWHRLKQCIASDRRIHLMGRTLSRPTLMGLMSCCDAYVSLHRAEGFGRGPAEAMLLRKPVVVTRFSGNLDFTKEDNACLVDCRMVDVQPHEYHFSQDQQWADPDIDHASEHMRRLASEPDYAGRIGRAGHAHIATHHSARAAGERYCKRLRDLGLL